MVIEVEILVSSMPSKRRCMSSMESMATPTLPTSPDREWVVGIQANLRGQIEGDGEPGGSVGQQIFVALVGFLGVAHARVLAHGPEASAIHGGLHAAREWILAGVAHLPVVVPGFEIGRGVERADGDVGLGFWVGGSEPARGLHFVDHDNAINHKGHEGAQRKARPLKIYHAGSRIQFCL